MRKLFATTAVVLLAGMAVSSVAEAAPNRVRIVTVDGKARIKVTKKIPFLVSCSKNCGGKLTLTLVTPATNDAVSGNVVLDAGKIFRARYLLTNFGRRYVKKNIRKSKLKVKFSVVDFETGKRTVKRRTFRLYK